MKRGREGISGLLLFLQESLKLALVGSGCIMVCVIQIDEVETADLCCVEWSKMEWSGSESRNPLPPIYFL